MKIDELENLAREMAFASPEKKKSARDLINREAEKRGLFIGSIRPVYERMADGTYAGFAVPAVNVRGLVFDVARAAFDAAREAAAGPFMFEIAPVELAVSRQDFQEYAGEILAAALAENWEGPVFLQGDHFQIESDDPSRLSALVHECEKAIRSGYYQIDIDASDLQDDSDKSPEQRQAVSVATTSRLVQLVRDLPFPGREVLLGGEVGQIGGRLTTEEDLRAFLNGLSAILGPETPGIGKVSVNTGTQHGGVVDKDGNVGIMPVDFELIGRLSEIARREYGLPGIVQHGASTMSFDQMAQLPQRGVNEVHLATALQTLVFDHPAFPRSLLQRMESELGKSRDERRGPEDSRPKDGGGASVMREEGWLAWGRYKSELWNLSPEIRAELRRGIGIWFRQVLEALALAGKETVIRELSLSTRIGDER